VHCGEHEKIFFYTVQQRRKAARYSPELPVTFDQHNKMDYESIYIFLRGLGGTGNSGRIAPLPFRLLLSSCRGEVMGAALGDLVRPSGESRRSADRVSPLLPDCGVIVLEIGTVRPEGDDMNMWSLAARFLADRRSFSSSDSSGP
jgi:hypothetical protein